MRTEDKYLAFVRWSEQDKAYIGYCLDLFPAGGVCHGVSPAETFAALCDIIEDTVRTAEASGLPLATRCASIPHRTFESLSEQE